MTFNGAVSTVALGAVRIWISCFTDALFAREKTRALVESHSDGMTCAQSRSLGESHRIMSSIASINRSTLFKVHDFVNRRAIDASMLRTE